MIDGTYLAEKLRLRCIEDGDCLIWQGAMNERGPSMKVGGKQYSVRQAVWSNRAGRPFPKGWVATVGCGRKACLEHVVGMTRAAFNAKLNKRINPIRSRKVAAAKRANSRLSQDAVRAIRLDDRPMAVVAAEHGISTAYGYMLRREEFRKDFGGFADGLGARP